MNGLHRTRYFLYFIGNFLLTFGIVLTILSDLGTSPFDALLVGLSKKVGLTVGSWEILIAFCIIVINSLLARQRPEFSGLLTAFLTGVGIDLWLFLLQDSLQPELFATKLLCLAIGLIVIGLGSAIYLHANLAPIPVDRLMLIIRDLSGKSLFFAKTIIYIVFLAMAALFNGPIGIGTILTVCLGGPILQFFMSVINGMASKGTIKTIVPPTNKDHTI
ncbi:YczE/YyaS/YitT family protein [Lysinibacillus yapensis]|uniref:YczE/YyaS/YitT family protein n=1 Tax=Ureibacillus yapensis TaxID=2304605 RepID=UPI001F174BF7|nr:YitT family protein [Lysinibacillus yapensis]